MFEFHLQFRDTAVFTLFGVTILRLRVRQFELTSVVNIVVLHAQIPQYALGHTIKVSCAYAEMY